jgi:5-methylcytosine-specific restriction endonuclease McrA
MQRVLVVDKNRNPLMPCNPARARELIKKGKAKVLRHYPFTIILLERENGNLQESQIKFDTGAKVSGIAVVANFKRGLICVWAAELQHRSFVIRDSLLRRRYVRRSRRNRKTRYRIPRFSNRKHKKLKIRPSLMSRIHNLETWLERLMKFIPISCIALELVRFDTQALENPEISGVEYQQGELMGYEVREYLLEKWERQCAYCGKTNIPLQIEHIIPKSRGGSNRLNNLTLACKNCNRKKANQTAAEFGYPQIQLKANQSLIYAAAVNTIRWIVFERFQLKGLSIEIGTGGRTKLNRIKQNYPKTHWIDAVCVGVSGEEVFIYPQHQALLITAVGHGSRQICRTDKYGFPASYRQRQKRHFDFQTGDIVQAVVPNGKYIGEYIGRVVCRTNGRFDVIGSSKKALGVYYKHCRLLHHSDGYNYSLR